MAVLLPFERQMEILPDINGALAESLTLRPYQIEAIEQLRQKLAAGHMRQILCAPTGAGKTEIACHLIQTAQAKGSRVSFVVDRIALVDQTSERLATYGIPHGVLQGQNTYGKDLPVQVCSAQTLEKRDEWHGVDLLILDEAHTQRKAIIKHAMEWAGPVVGLTATPLTRGLDKVYSNVVNATSTNKLIEEGWLTPLHVYHCLEIDMSGAMKTAGEWQASEVRTRSRPIIGNIVSEWVEKTHKHFEGPVKTLLFSADIPHGEELCAAFKAAGYDFRQSTFRDTEDETRALVKDFRQNKFIGLVSVEKFVKGFDVPDVLCLIGARPYSASLASVIQQLGRGMRASPGKTFCLYLDHAGNFAGWYNDILDVWEHGVSELPVSKATGATPQKKRLEGEDGRESKDFTCFKCGTVFIRGADNCAGCGAPRPVRRTNRRKVAGAMEELSPAQLKDAVAKGSRAWKQNPQWVWGHMLAVAHRWKAHDPAGARKLALRQYHVLYGKWPLYEWGVDPGEDWGDRRVERHMSQSIAAWRKGQADG